MDVAKRVICMVEIVSVIHLNWENIKTKIFWTVNKFKFVITRIFCDLLNKAV